MDHEEFLLSLQLLAEERVGKYARAQRHRENLQVAEGHAQLR